MRPSVLGIEGPGDYLSDEFLRCIRAKLDLVVQSIAENPGKVIVWSDVDIQLVELTPTALNALLAASGSDLLFQRESPRMAEVNTGFIVCRCTPATLGLFERVRDELELHREENEQMVVNRLLLCRKRGLQNKESEVRQPAPIWDYLPSSFYARTHGWPPPRRISIYHANYTKGPDAIGQKMAQFSEVDKIRKGGFPAWCWSVIKRLPGKLPKICIPS